MVEHEEQKKRIVEAAKVRLAQFGAAKTTMNEIASDLGMTAANLYRYFESKDDLLVAAANGWCEQAEGMLAPLADLAGLSPVEKLERFFLTQLEMVYMGATMAPMVAETMEVVVRAHPQVGVRHGQVIAGVVAKIIKEGVESGDFASDDPLATANLLINLMNRFNTPSNVLLGKIPLEELKVQATESVALLVNGIRARAT